MKDTLTLIEVLEEHIDRLATDGIYEIERDLLLERLRGLYASALMIEAVAEEDRVLDALMGLGVADAAAEDASEPEIEIERFFADEESNEELAENVEEKRNVEDYLQLESEMCVMYGCPPADYEPVDERLEQDMVAEEEPEVEEVAEVAEVEAEPAATPEIDHKAAMSLYDDDEAEEEALEIVFEEETLEEAGSEEMVAEESEETLVADEDMPVEEPVVEEVLDVEVADDDLATESVTDAPTVVLGDLLREDTPTLADNFAEQSSVDVATAASATMSLRQTIGVNDKYILMRDLFAGDNAYYESAIEALDEFESLDEAMLYIYDNFHWSPNSEGARLLMELLARKLF